MSREKNIKEIKKEFVNYIHELVEYWNNNEKKTVKEKLNGLAFSILVLLDGESANFPQFIVVPAPHKDDKQYHIEQNEDYYPDNDIDNINANISGELHDLFSK